MLKHNFQLMAAYNQNMNSQCYAAAAQLSPESLNEDRGAFFKSVLGTLNHILVGDIVWLKRFADHQAQFASLAALRQMERPATLEAILHDDLPALLQARQELDCIIVGFCDELTEQDLASALSSADMKDNPFQLPLADLLQHFFNHQTHHRGQLTTLLSQFGIDVGVTDLLATIRVQHS